jgi:hypothetical protein
MICIPDLVHTKGDFIPAVYRLITDKGQSTDTLPSYDQRENSIIKTGIPNFPDSNKTPDTTRVTREIEKWIGKKRYQKYLF